MWTCERRTARLHGQRVHRLGSTDSLFLLVDYQGSARGPAVPRMEKTAKKAEPQIRLKAVPLIKLALPTAAAKAAGSLTPPAEMRQPVASVGAALHSRQLA